MPRFRFPLDPVLRMRERAEQARLADVASAEAERQRLEAAIRREQALLVQGQQRQRDRLQGRVDMRDLRSDARATLGAMRRASRLAVELAGTYRRCEEARRQLMLASRDRRAVERLREQLEAAWRREQDRRESNRLDDIAAETWRRGRADEAAGRHEPTREDAA